MKNRTNLTLSALATSTRLNRGTRSLALGAGSNHGQSSSCVRPGLHGDRRDSVVQMVSMPIPHGVRTIPPQIPFDQSQRQVFTCPARGEERLAARAARAAGIPVARTGLKRKGWLAVQAG